MKKGKRIGTVLIAVVCMICCVGCGAFDTSGYIKAVLDNSIKGESAALIEFTRASKEEAAAIYDEQIQSNMEQLLTGVSLDEQLEEEYRTFVADMLDKTRYEVGESIKNSDGTYTVSVKTYALELDTTNLITEKTTEYVDELQTLASNGSQLPSQEEIIAQTYRITLDCLKASLADAVYADATDNTVTVSLENKLYTPDQTQLDALCAKLIEVK